MEKTTSGNITGFVNRRLHPVRLGIGHLNRVLEGSRSGSMVNVNRDLIQSVTSTLEIFLEDFESKCLESGGLPEEKKSHEKLAETPRVTQTRVS